MSAAGSATQNASRPKRPLRRDHPTHAAARLTKPFRTPLRPSPARQTPASVVTAQAHASQQQCSDVDTASDNGTQGVPRESPAAADLYRQYRTLSRQLTQMRQSLDTVQQAIRILKDDQATTLRALTEKWKVVVREAAEELYDDAKERHDREGLSMWNRRRSFADSNDQYASLSDDEKALLRAREEEAHAEAVKYGLLDCANQDSEAATETVSLQRRIREPTNTPPVLHHGYNAATDVGKPRSRRLRRGRTAVEDMSPANQYRHQWDARSRGHLCFDGICGISASYQAYLKHYVTHILQNEDACQLLLQSTPR